MIGWIESNNIFFETIPYIEGCVIKIITNFNYKEPYEVIDLDTKYDAELAAIDVALDYLEKGEQL